MDTKNCMKLENFQADIIKKGFSDELIKEAKEKLKINKVCLIKTMSKVEFLSNMNFCLIFFKEEK